MPSTHPTLALRIPEALYASLETRAAEVGCSMNQYILLMLAAQLGFERDDADEVVASLLKRHDRESKATATRKAREEKS